MITVIIKNNGGHRGLVDTKKAILRELQDIPGSEVIAAEDWLEALDVVKTRFVCFVETNCIISGGYFSSLVGLITKDLTLRKLGILGSATGVLNFGNRVYGYVYAQKLSDGLVPVRTASSSKIYPVQIAFIPGAVMRTKMLKKAMANFYNAAGHEDHDEEVPFIPADNPVQFSASLSLLFWALGDGHRVAINPSTSYVTPESSPGEPTKYPVDPGELLDVFVKAGIR